MSVNGNKFATGARNLTEPGNKLINYSMDTITSQ